MRFGFLAIAAVIFLTGCLYKMPDDDCISTLPTSNNPLITREKASSLPQSRG